MEFGDNHKVLLDTLDELEAGVYVSFLEAEISRHRDAVDMCKLDIEIFDSRDRCDKVYCQFLKSAIMRHNEDIESSQELIETVKEKFKL